MSTDPANRLEELQSQLNTRQEALQSRVHSILQETGETTLPELEELREERVRLMQEIQHHKDEGDAILLQVETQENAAAVYRVAARVQKLEEFADRAEKYVANELPNEIQRIAECDRRHSNDEVAALFAELQAKREAEMRRIGNLQKRTQKRANDIRNGPRVEHGELGAKSRVAKTKEEEPDKITKDTLTYTEEARYTKAELKTKIDKLRADRSKLQVELLDQKHKNDKIIHELQGRIRNADLSNKRDVRLCQQLNTGNAALTTNAQTLLGQLNAAHYGVEGGPTEKMLIEMRKEEERRAAAKANEEEKVNGNNTNYNNNNNNNNNNEENHNGQPGSNSRRGSYQRHDTDNSLGGASGVSSQRQARPPLVALKRTESQRQREAANVQERREKEEAAAASTTGVSPARSRTGADSNSNNNNYNNNNNARPPLVASKHTSSQRNREAAVQEEVSAARKGRRASSHASDASPMRGTPQNRQGAGSSRVSRNDSRNSNLQ